MSESWAPGAAAHHTCGELVPRGPSSHTVTKLDFPRTKNVGALWLGRSVVSGNDRQISRSCSRAPTDGAGYSLAGWLPWVRQEQSRAGMDKIRVLSHCGNADSLDVPTDLRARVEIVEVPQSGPLPADSRGEILLTRRRADNLYDAAEAVRWVHILG